MPSQATTGGRLKRADRREQILASATEVFARSGFAATNLDDIATEAGVTRVILYRHFDSKSDLYQAVLDRMCARLEAHIDEPTDGFNDESIDGLLAVAAESPAGFRLLFNHALREAEFKERIEKFRTDISQAVFQQVSPFVLDEPLARWVAHLAPATAIEATIAWLDAGQPDPQLTAARIRRVVIAIVEAAIADDLTASLPHQPPTKKGPTDEHL